MHALTVEEVCFFFLFLILAILFLSDIFVRDLHYQLFVYNLVIFFFDLRTFIFYFCAFDPSLTSSACNLNVLIFLFNI